MKKIFVILFILAAGFSSHSQTARIEFGNPGLYPEGTTYDNQAKRFFVSSATTGTIGTVTPDGKYTVFYKNDSLKSTFGMKIDSVRHRLLICAGDPNYSRFQTPATFRHQIRLIGIDLITAKKTLDIDLSDLFKGPHFANDLALDEKGNVYITDSYSPVIYKVDAAGKATVFATSELFKGTGIGLNGIVYGKGFLLVVNGSSGSLLRISVSTPIAISPVVCPLFFNGGDGLLWDGNDLLIAQNKGINKITRVSSSDDWKTAWKVSATGGNDRFANPSTITQSNGRFYALNAKLNELTDSTLPRSPTFSLQEIILK